MAHNLTESSLFDATVPVPDDGDSRNAASVNGAFQALANRSKFLHDAITNGATHLRTVADAAALRALTSHANGDCAALSGGSGGALFVYDAASSVTDDGVLVVKPTDVGGGAGRWLHPARALLGHANTWSATQTFGIVNAGALSASSLATTSGGSITADGALACGTDLVVTATCTVGGVCNLLAGLAVTGGFTVTGSATLGSTLAVTGGVHLLAGLLVDSTCTITGAATCSSTLAVTGLATLGGGVAINGASTLTRPLALSSTGTVAWRAVAGVDANHTYGVDVADDVIVPSVTGDRDYTLSTTGAVNGSRIRFSVQDATHLITIVNATDIDVPLKNASGFITAVEFTYLNSVWRSTIVTHRP